MLSKKFLREYAKYLEQRELERKKQEFLSQFCSIQTFEHIGVGKGVWKVSNAECQAQIGDRIHVRFVHPRTKSGQDYMTRWCKVYGKDTEYTYIMAE